MFVSWSIVSVRLLLFLFSVRLLLLLCLVWLQIVVECCWLDLFDCCYSFLFDFQKFMIWLALGKARRIFILCRMALIWIQYWMLVYGLPVYVIQGASRSPPGQHLKLLSLSRSVHYVGLTFTILGSLWDAFLQSWDHFWSTFGYISQVKKRPGALEVPPEALKWDTPKQTNFVGPHLRVLFWRCLLLFINLSRFFQCLFKALYVGPGLHFG